VPNPSDKLKAGIESLTFRIAALAERLAGESSSRGDTPRETVRQINEYYRAKRALQAELDALAVGATAQSDSTAADQINAIDIVQQDHTKSEDVTDRQPFWRRNS
jgi:hypothetical protein